MSIIDAMYAVGMTALSRVCEIAKLLFLLLQKDKLFISIRLIWIYPKIFGVQTMAFKNWWCLRNVSNYVDVTQLFILENFSQIKLYERHTQHTKTIQSNCKYTHLLSSHLRFLLEIYLCNAQAQAKGNKHMTESI